MCIPVGLFCQHFHFSLHCCFHWWFVLVLEHLLFDDTRFLVDMFSCCILLICCPLSVDCRRYTICRILYAVSSLAFWFVPYSYEVLYFCVRRPVLLCSGCLYALQCKATGKVDSTPVNSRLQPTDPPTAQHDSPLCSLTFSPQILLHVVIEEWHPVFR
jgi:hypothetical protein